MSDEIIELEGTLEHETDEAWKANFGGKHDYWLPKSQVEFEAKRPGSEFGTFFVPEWLAMDRGLI